MHPHDPNHSPNPNAAPGSSPLETEAHRNGTNGSPSSNGIAAPLAQPVPGAPACYLPGQDYRYPGFYPPVMMPVQGTSSATGPTGFFDPVSIAMGLKRRWFQALFFSIVLGAGAAALTWRFWPPDAWLVEASIRVDPTHKPIFFGDVAAGPQTRAELYSFLQAQIGIVRSHTVLTKVIERPEISALPLFKEIAERKENPIDWLLKNLITRYYNSEILVIGLQGQDPEGLKLLANAIVQSYLALAKNQDVTNLDSQLELLQQVYERYYKRLQQQDQARRNIVDAMGTHDEHDDSIRKRFAWKQLDMAEEETIKWSNRHRQLAFELERQTKELERVSKADVPLAAIDAWCAKDPEVIALEAKKNELLGYLDEYARTLVGGKESQAYKATEHDLERAKYALQARIRLLKPLADEEIRENLVRHQSLVVKDTKAQIEQCEALLAEATSEKQEMIKQTRDVNRNSMDLDDIKAEIAATRETISQINARMEHIRVEQLNPSQITMLDPAHATAPGIGKKQVSATVAIGLGTLALTLLWVAWREYRMRKIHSLDEVVRGLGLKVVGTLPALPDRGTRYPAPARGGAEGFWPNYLIESVDTTRTMLLHAARAEGVRSVLITSAQSGEGKTSLAVQLAASLARAGRKTLFIDGDMRSPAAHQVFNLPLGPGLSELLRGEVQIASAIRPTSVRGLWMIPAGQWSAEATEALAQDGARTLLNRLKTEFDLIIVDSSPALAVVDGLLLGQQADAAIFSIMQAVSHFPSVFAAHQRLESLGIRILGAVMSGVTTSKKEYKQLGYIRETQVSSGRAAEATEEELVFE